jgi:hypothetical protein
MKGLARCGQILQPLFYCTPLCPVPSVAGLASKILYKVAEFASYSRTVIVPEKHRVPSAPL